MTETHALADAALAKALGGLDFSIYNQLLRLDIVQRGALGEKANILRLTRTCTRSEAM
ncbi:hypothetical protein [Bosea caraganae]|uniref:hypothetical protein n=1 Tax=Bosea caraganae TaxID=2763117 RepID=UPI0015EFEDA2|nr:hypothetical protein [Bosea caraganae]